MSLTDKQIENFRILLQGKTLPWSKLNKEIRQKLTDEHCVTIISHSTHRSLFAPSPNSLQLFLEQYYEELRGFDWESGSFTRASTRSELAQNSGNSKSRYLRSCPGFLVNSYSPVPALLNGKEIFVEQEEGAMLFISDWEHFEISVDTLVIGVENMENFRFIRKQKHLFLTDRPILFVSRYPQSSDLIRWLMQIPNPYLHFGDFDLAGIHIYETEFYRYLGNRASFFVPDDIEQRLQNGSIERYDSQYRRLKDYVPTDERVMPLYKLIQKYHRCYDQEGYILSKKSK